MAAKLKHRGLRTIATIAIIFGLISWVLRPIRETDFATGFTPLKRRLVGG
ncbi:MAG: hypothetical protein U1F27_01615 [Turneriella sp.]